MRVAPLPARARERTGYGGAMPKANPWNKSVPRVELDQPARNTHFWPGRRLPDERRLLTGSLR
jgi:hypothetical protein